MLLSVLTEATPRGRDPVPPDRNFLACRPDEDGRGGFEHGYWATPYADAVMGNVVGESMASTGAMLLGRRTYEDFYAFWPSQTDNPFTEVLNNTQKYVASRTLREPLA